MKKKTLLQNLELLEYRVNDLEDSNNKKNHTLTLLSHWVVVLIIATSIVSGFIFYHHEKFNF